MIKCEFHKLDGEGQKGVQLEGGLGRIGCLVGGERGIQNRGGDICKGGAKRWWCFGGE